MTNKPELIKYVLIEVDNCLNILVEGIEELETKGFNKSTIESLFRAAHTLKGSASIVNFNKITTLANKLEAIIGGILNKELIFDTFIISTIKNLVNLIVNLVNEVHNSGEEKTEIEKEIIDLVDNILNQKKTADHDFLAFDIEKVFESLNHVVFKKNIITDREKELIQIVEEISQSKKRLLSEIDNFLKKCQFQVYQNGERALKGFYVDSGQIGFDRSDEYKILFKKLQDITNDMSKEINDLLLFAENLSSNLKSLNREIDYLKHYLVQINMIPIENLLYKISNDIKARAKDIGKTVEIEIKDSEIKIVKSLFNSLYEPITHILYNAIQHGIESMEDRIKKGKEQIGHIKIDVNKEGRYVVVTIKDDGKGIDVDKIKQIALQKQLISSDNISFISKEELLSYIFLPGFSTSEQTDLHSGRGIGLSIVKDTISKLQGSIEVFSEVDKGTSFILKIPHLLNISNLLIFSSHNMNFAVPVNYIEEILALEDFPSAVEERVVTHKNKEIPIKIFSEIFFTEDRTLLKNGYIIVFNFSGTEKALIVDKICEHKEVIFYNFGELLEGLRQYLGYFISEGSPIYVLDPVRLFEDELI